MTREAVTDEEYYLEFMTIAHNCTVEELPFYEEAQCGEPDGSGRGSEAESPGSAGCGGDA